MQRLAFTLAANGAIFDMHAHIGKYVCADLNKSGKSGYADRKRQGHKHTPALQLQKQ